MASSRWLHSSLIFLWHRTPFSKAQMNVNSGFCLRQPEVRAPRDPAESAVTVSLGFFWGGRRCSDWILTVPWPWAALALSTKQYVHTYHETRHKSLSLRWTLNQVVVSGWGKRGLLRTRGANREHPVHHIIVHVKKTTRLGNVEGILHVFIRLLLQMPGRKPAPQRILYAFGSRRLNFFDSYSRPRLLKQVLPSWRVAQHLKRLQTWTSPPPSEVPPASPLPDLWGSESRGWLIVMASQ